VVDLINRIRRQEQIYVRRHSSSWARVPTELQSQPLEHQYLGIQSGSQLGDSTRHFLVP